MQAVRKVLTAWPIEYNYTDGGVKVQIKGHSYPHFEVPSAVDGNLALEATAIAQQKFAKKAQQKITTWQGGVAAGEFRESVRQLASPTKRLRSEVSNLLSEMVLLKRRIVKNPRLLETHVTKSSVKTLNSLRNAIADTWLEWSFGVKPMISDCQDAYLAFRKMALGRRIDKVHIKASHAVREKQYASIGAVTGIVASGAGLLQYDVIEENFAETHFRAAYVWRSVDGNFPIPQLFGVDLSNFAPTAWELIPWSFLVDYFTDVGSAIEAASIRTVEFAWVNYTVRNSRTLKMVRPRTEWGSFVMQNYKPSVWCPHPYVAKGTLTTVDRFAGLPPMTPYVPHFKLPHSDTKWLNIAALLNGMLQLKS
jgi:hypothetical protein